MIIKEVEQSEKDMIGSLLDDTLDDEDIPSM
jgi:hypothetical protein